MIMIFRMALDGLKSSGTEFRAHLADTLNDTGLLSTKEEPDIGYCPVFKYSRFE